jgi:hypothetical protein
MHCIFGLISFCLLDLTFEALLFALFHGDEAYMCAYLGVCVCARARMRVRR